MAATQIHDVQFLTIWWDEKTGIIGIDWKEETAPMTDEQFKMELSLFASHVEKQKARGILVDVSRFRHKMAPEVQQWRAENISSRHDGAGVQGFAFLLPKSTDIPVVACEKFATRAFTD